MISLFDGLFFLAIVLAMLYFYLSRSFNYWKKRGIAYDENASVIFGTMTDGFLGRKAMGEVFLDLYKKYPGEKVVGWFKFRSPGILIRDPELVKKVLVNDFHSFRNNDLIMDPEVDPILGNNLFVLRDELWKKRRALITPAFTAGKIKAIFSPMLGISKDLVSYLKQHPEEIHVKHLISRYTSDIVAQCAFGIEGNNLKEPKPMMYELGKLIFDSDPIRYLVTMSFFFMPKISKLLKLKMVPTKVLKFFDSVLKDVIVHRQENNIERNDLVQYLIEVKRKTLAVAEGTIESDLVTKVYTDDDVLSGCVSFFVEGYETSALVVNNILYYLALHKDAQDTLRDEVNQTLSEGELTFEKIQEMSYLNSVFLEANRLLPVMFHLQKVCTENYEMDVGKDKPLLIEKGTSVILPVHGIQNDPLYWEDADQFKPERFFGKEEANAKAKGLYLPFGDGPRMCPGMRIATTMVKLAVLQIVANMEIVPTSKTPKKIIYDPNYFMVAHKGGIYLKFVPKSR